MTRQFESHNLLAGKRGVIFGVVDQASLAWFIARQCVSEGAQIVLTNTPQAIQLGQAAQLAEQLNVPLIACDASQVADLTTLFQQAQSQLGGKIDFVLHAVALSQNLRRHKGYTDLNYSYYNTTLDVSAISLHKLLQVCMQMDALSEGASVVTLSYIASSRFMDGYGDMSDAKALLESIVRNMGGKYGQLKGVRVNAISQSPTATRAEHGFREVNYFHTFANQMAPLGLSSAEQCAQLCVMLFSDYTSGVTMQTLYNDGGFSQTVMSNKFVEFFRETMEGLDSGITDKKQ